MTTALTAAAFFSGCHESACKFFKEYRCILKMLSDSRFSRRLAAIPESVWRGLADWLASAAHDFNSLRFYVADSFSVPVCKNIRIKRCKIYQEEFFRGYVSSRKEYFYGIKVSVIMTESGIPSEIIPSHEGCSYIAAFHNFMI